MKTQKEIGLIFLNKTRTGNEFLAGWIEFGGEKLRFNLRENQYWSGDYKRPYYKVFKDSK